MIDFLLIWLNCVVHGVEYGFGAHDHSTTGIFEVEPRQCPGFTFRKSILVGRTDLGPKEVRAFMEKLAEEYSGNTYHLITKNCNHFCNDVCVKLTSKPIPRWVNRLARLGKNPYSNYFSFKLLIVYETVGRWKLIVISSWFYTLLFMESRNQFCSSIHILFAHNCQLFSLFLSRESLVIPNEMVIG